MSNFWIKVDASCAAAALGYQIAWEWWNAWQAGRQRLHDNDTQQQRRRLQKRKKSVIQSFLDGNYEIIFSFHCRQSDMLIYTQHWEQWIDNSSESWKKKKKEKMGKNCIKLNREKIKKHPPYTGRFSPRYPPPIVVWCCAVLRYVKQQHHNTEQLREREEERNCSFDI